MSPLMLIEALRKTDKYIEVIYMQGGCYKFHIFLREIWPCATPVINKDKDHVGSLIDGIVYDINGIAEWEYTNMDADDIEMAERWSFAKSKMISLGECPVCDEPLVV